MPHHKYLALLRGINVGGKHILPMKVLQEMFIEAGCVDALTYIQSGNVVFTAPPKVAARIPALIPARIEEAFGFGSPVIVRSKEQLAGVIAANPFLAAQAAPEALHVMFLQDRPEVSAVRALDPDRFLPDTFEVIGHEIYLYLPNGAGRTKLNSINFDAKLKTISTQRNWRTVNKLMELMAVR